MSLLRMKMPLICFLMFNILGLISFGNCDTQAHRCVFTLKYQMSGAEFVRNFYSGDKILKITDDYADWKIQKFWEKNMDEMDLIKVNYIENQMSRAVTLKEMKNMEENSTLSQKVGLMDKVLLDAIPTPITILSCRDLYYSFQNSVVYTLHYSNEQSYMDISLNGPAYLIVISGKLHVTLQSSKGRCQNTFNSGELVYIPTEFGMVKSVTHGTFLAVTMAWKPNQQQSKIICKPLTLQFLTIDLREEEYDSLYDETRTRQLNTGSLIPPLGLTINNIGLNDAAILKEALKLGYKLFHISKTINRHGTKLPSEEMLKMAMEETKTLREEIYISVRMNMEFIDNVLTIENIIQDTLEKLNTSYIDLVTIELPFYNNFTKTNKKLLHIWKSITTIKAERAIHALGVCNVESIQTLEAIYAFTKQELSVVENWFDIQRPDEDVRQRCKELNIIYMAYGLFGTVRMKLEKTKANKILTSPQLKNIAGSYHLPVSRLLLMWAMQKDIIVKPSTSDFYHLESNLYSTGLQIMQEQLKELDALAGLKPVDLNSHQKHCHKITNDEL